MPPIEAPTLRLTMRLPIVPAAMGFVLGPVAIILHEVGHVLGAVAAGAAFSIHATSTSIHGDAAPLEMTTLIVAGPAVELVLSTLGLVVLTRRRRGGPKLSADAIDWLATAMAGLCLRWLTRVPVGAISGFVSGFYSIDEAFVSENIGLPPWGLPLLLCFPAALAFRHLIRQHPAGARLLPLSALFAAQGLGVLLWISFLAPRLLSARPLD